MRRHENLVPSGASTPMGRMADAHETRLRAARPRRARRTCGRRGRGARSRRRPAFVSTSSSWRPRATTRPSSSTTISSASAIVERRWAMMIVVRPRMTVSSARRMRASVVASTDAVASSRIRTRGSASRARAIGDALPLAAREREAALADERVVAVGQRLDELVRLRLARGLDRRPRRVAPGSPKAMLAATVVENRNVSSATVAIAPRRSARRRSRTSAPSSARGRPAGRRSAG